jgi:16S rRNA (cytidine1402-2'-O)-methyltransferase
MVALIRKRSDGMSGTLHMVASPIGNLGDITLRALEVLRAADVIYAEDTRVSSKLLARYEISKPLRSFREAAPRYQVERILGQICRELEAGMELAYLSDAGTPAVSDPGTYLVQWVTAAGYSVSPVPGPSALAAIMSVSGLSVTMPIFIGFLPRKKGHQSTLIKIHSALVQEYADAAIFYESPERIVSLLGELTSWNLPLSVCLGRELTKKFEEILRGSLAEVATALQNRPVIKGEIVILISPRHE